MFRDKLWAAEVGNVLGMYAEGIPVSDAYDLLADWIEDHPEIQREMGIALAKKDFTELKKQREAEEREKADAEAATGYVADFLPGVADALPKIPRAVYVTPNRTKDKLDLRFSDVVKVLNIVDNRAQQMIDGGEQYKKDEHRKWDPILAALPSDDSRTIAEIIDNRPDEEYGAQ